jgi:hypothetical protein
MSDSFSFGEPARRRPRLDGRAPRSAKPEPQLGRSRSSIGVAIVAGGVAILIAFGALSVIHRGGSAAAEAEHTAVSQVDGAQDVQAQLALQQASSTARVLQAEAASGPGFDRAGAGSLASYDPSLGATGAASTGPGSVSVAVTTTGWAAAAMSTSGACYWIHLDAAGTVAYGTGTPCTGQAAMAAADAAW